MKQKRQLSLDSNFGHLKDKYMMAKCHKPGACPPEPTRSAVTEEARIVLEQFLKRSLSQNDASPVRHQFQLRHEAIPEEDNKDTVDGPTQFLDIPQPANRPLKKSLTPEYIRSDSYRAAATQGSIIKDESKRKSQTLPNVRNIKRQGSRESSKEALSSLQSSGASYSRPSQQHSPMSYSSADEGHSENSDIVSLDGMRRKKKSFFKRASEWLRHSFRIQSRNKDECEDDIRNKVAKTKKRRKNKSKLDASGEKSRSPDSRTSSQAQTPSNDHRIDSHTVLVESYSFEGTIDTLESSQGTIGSLDNRNEKQSKNKKLKRKDSPEGHAADESNPWERLLHHIRKKGLKIRRKLAKEDSFNRRSKSAEPLASSVTPSPPSENDSVLLSRLDHHNDTSLAKRYRFSADNSTHSKDHYNKQEKQKLEAVIETWRGAHEVRRVLRLDGLDQCRPSSPEVSPVNDGEGFDEVGGHMYMEAEGGVRARGAAASRTQHNFSHGAKIGYSKRVSKVTVRRLPSDVEADNLDEPDNAVPEHQELSGQIQGDLDKPFHERSENEKEEVFEKIAQKLAAIADNYNTVAGSPSPLESSLSDYETEGSQSTKVVRVPSLEKKIANVLRSRGDGFSETQPLAASAMSDILTHASYSSFKQVVNKEIGKEPGVQQLATLFQITKSAVQLAGAGGSMAVQVKENALRYFEDKFASWIVGKGGWESMIDESELDSEVD